MATDFFKRKRWFYVACSQLSAGFIIVCMVLALTANYTTPVWVGRSFYFLVSENAHIDVTTHETRLDGGAGYLLDYEGDSYVAWSVYLKKSDGEAVQVGISEPTKLVEADVTYLYFKTRAEKRKKNLFKGALDSFYGCIDVLSQGIVRLDKGLTQQACKRILSLLQKEFTYMEKKYREIMDEIIRTREFMDEFKAQAAEVHRLIEADRIAVERIRLRKNKERE